MKVDLRKKKIRQHYNAATANHVFGASKGPGQHDMTTRRLITA